MMEGAFNITSGYTRREFTYTTSTGFALAGAYSVDAAGGVTELSFQSSDGFGGSFDGGGSASLWGVPPGRAAECGEAADAVFAAASAAEAAAQAETTDTETAGTDTESTDGESADGDAVEA